MNNYTVYKHIFPNGKIYVGITCQNPERRWSNGNGYSRQKLLYNAITKYKWHNIEHKILYTYLTKEEAEQKIRQYHLGKIASQREITQHTVDNKKIKNYKSILIASKETNINKANICSCCKGKLKTAGRYIWKYKEEE